MKRRDFIRNIAIGGVVLANGRAMTRTIYLDQEEVVFRFTVASDGHYGQPDTPYENYFKTIVRKINFYHAVFPSDFVVFNGDIIHDDPQFIAPAHQALKLSKMPLYATKGNHDKVSPTRWEEVWGFPQNHHFTVGDRVVLLGTTANEKGEYLCPDLDWFEKQLDAYRSAPEIYIFLHITPNKWTKHGIDCPEFHELLARHTNVSAVFNGHDHDQDGIKTKGNIPFLFDGHFGGAWGTEYRGFRVVERLKNGTLRTYLMNPDDQILLNEI